MMRHWIALIALIALAAAAPLQAADDLHSIYLTAKQSDPQYLSAQAARLATEEVAVQARAGYYPTIDLSADATKNWRSAPGKDNRANTYRLSLNQPIYRRDTYVANDQAKAQVAQAEVNFEAADQGLIQRVAEAYFNTLAAQDNLQFAQAEMAAIERQLEQTKQRFEVGLIAITDVHESQAAYDNAAASTIVAENRLAIAKVTLAEITNQPIDQLAILKDGLPLQMPQASELEQWLDEAQQRNKPLAALTQDVKIAEEQVEAARSGHYPTVDLQASHTYSDDVFSDFTGDKVTSLKLQLNVPLYRGGQTNSLVRQAHHQLSQAKEVYEQQRRAVERSVRSAYLDITANIRLRRCNRHWSPAVAPWRPPRPGWKWVPAPRWTYSMPAVKFIAPKAALPRPNTTTFSAPCA